MKSEWTSGSIEPEGPTGAHFTAIQLLGIAADPPAPGSPEGRHLVECLRCQREAERLDLWLGQASQEARDEVDGFFDAQLLFAQRQQIARRLETLERPAEIIAFPTRRSGVVRAPRGPQRWIAAAAVVGLMTGLAAGRFLHVHSGNIVSDSHAAISPASVVDIPLHNDVQTLSASVAASDETFLIELSAALDEPTVAAELQVIDALTPEDREPSYAP